MLLYCRYCATLTNKAPCEIDQYWSPFLITKSVQVIAQYQSSLLVITNESVVKPAAREKF